MYMQTVGPAPELDNNPQPQPSAEPAPDMLVQYPKSAPIAVALPRQRVWDGIVAAARSRRSTAPGRAEHLSLGEVPGGQRFAGEPGALLSWVAVGTGLAFVAAAWAAILF